MLALGTQTDKWIRWTLTPYLNDLDYTAGICLPLYSYRNIAEQLDTITHEATTYDLKNRGKLNPFDLIQTGIWTAEYY